MLYFNFTCPLDLHEWVQRWGTLRKRKWGEGGGEWGRGLTQQVTIKSSIKQGRSPVVNTSDLKLRLKSPQKVDIKIT